MFSESRARPVREADNTAITRKLVCASMACYGDNLNFLYVDDVRDRLCCLVVRIFAADPEVPGSIPGATRFSE
jgi:hypothetical protein